MVLSATGEPVVASPEGLAALDRNTGKMELRAPIERDKPENRANDVKVDARGRVWVGTMAYDKRPRSAALYRVDGDRVTRVVEGLTISNGPAFDESRGRLYLADTAILRSLTLSTWTPKRAPSAIAGVSSISAMRRSGRTA